jgi:hypothetical protein
MKDARLKLQKASNTLQFWLFCALHGGVLATMVSIIISYVRIWIRGER